MLTASFVNNRDINNNVRPRNPISGSLSFSCNRVGNQGEVLENVVEVGVARSVLEPFNIIIITENGVQTVGFIQSLHYVNDNNTAVNFIVDGWLTLTNRDGSIRPYGYICEATLETPMTATNFVNLAPIIQNSHFSETQDNIVTENLAQIINVYEGGLPTIGSINYVVWVTNYLDRICQVYTGNYSATPPINFTISITNSYRAIATRTSFSTLGFARSRTGWGEPMDGVPYVFTDINTAKNFIHNILNIGLIAVNGNSDLTANNFYDIGALNSTMTGIVMETSIKNAASFVQNFDTLNNIMPITEILQPSPDDIIRIHAIPQLLAQQVYNDSPPVPVSGELNFSSADIAGNVNNKMNSYPYLYYTIQNSYGDSLDIIPQSHMNLGTAFLSLFYTIHFVGGVEPKLFFSLRENFNLATSLNNREIAIREYPSINIGFDNAQANLRINAVKSRLGEVQNVATGVNSNLAASEIGLINTIASGISRHSSQITNVFTTMPTNTQAGTNVQGSFLTNPFSANNTLANNMALMNNSRTAGVANRIASSAILQASTTVQGTGGIWELLYNRTPLVVMIRGIPVLERLRASGHNSAKETINDSLLINYDVGGMIGVNLNIGETNILGGVSSRTFYRFRSVHVAGNARYANEVIEMFINGVWVINN